MKIETILTKWARQRAMQNRQLLVEKAWVDPVWEEGDEVICVASATQDWACEANKNKAQVEIPTEYQQHHVLFSEKVAWRFPPSRPKDHAIRLKPRALDTINCKVYPLSQKEQEFTQTMIEENEEMKQI